MILLNVYLFLWILMILECPKEEVILILYDPRKVEKEGAKLH